MHWKKWIYAATIKLGLPGEVPPPQPIDPVIYHNMFTYAHLIDITYCIDRFHGIGEPFECDLECSSRFQNVSLVHQWHFDDSVCGYIASTRSDIFHYHTVPELARAKKTIIVAIRGTRSLHDTVTDLQVAMVPYGGVHQRLPPCGADCKVHLGFLRYYEATLAAVEPYLLEQLRDIGSDDYELVLLGHSMGGSVALLLALYCLEHGFDKVSLVTMGQPLTGNKPFVSWADSVLGSTQPLEHSSFDRKFIRVLHKDDIVTQVPMHGTDVFDVYHAFDNQIYVNSTGRTVEPGLDDVVECWTADHPRCIKKDFSGTFLAGHRNYYRAHNTYFRRMGLCGLHI